MILVEVLVPIFSILIMIAIFVAIFFRIRARRGIYNPQEVFVDEELHTKTYLPLSLKSPNKAPLNVTLIPHDGKLFKIQSKGSSPVPQQQQQQKQQQQQQQQQQKQQQQQQLQQQAPLKAKTAPTSEATVASKPVSSPPSRQNLDAMSTTTSYSKGTLSNTSASEDEDDNRNLKQTSGSTNALPAYYPPPSYATLGPKQEYFI